MSCAAIEGEKPRMNRVAIAIRVVFMEEPAFCHCTVAPNMAKSQGTMPLPCKRPL